MSCSKRIEPDALDKMVRANDADKIYTSFYRLDRVNREKLTAVVGEYSDQIVEKNLVTRPIDDNSLRKVLLNQERLGYQYLDSDGNLHYSITYKLTKLEDSTEKFNFIDFRATDRDLPCVKVPSFMPIKCIYKAEDVDELLSYKSRLDSLKSIGPIEQYGWTIYHYEILKQANREKPRDSVRSAIIFNIDNKWVAGRFELLIKDLGQKVDLWNYDLGYMRDISTPKLRIAFDSGFNPIDAELILKYFEHQTGKDFILTPLFDKEFEPFTGNFYIGHAEEEKRKIRY